MIKPGELIDKVTLHTDLRYATNEELGRGGFGFDLRVNRDIVNGLRCKIGNRDCWIGITGQFIVSGTLKVTKEFWCRIVISVEPTNENAEDGYAYHCFYSEKSQDYKYTKDAEKLVAELLHIMNRAWRYEDNVYENVIPEKAGGQAYDGTARLSTYTNLGKYNPRLLY